MTTFLDLLGHPNVLEMLYEHATNIAWMELYWKIGRLCKLGNERRVAFRVNAPMFSLVMKLRNILFPLTWQASRRMFDGNRRRALDYIVFKTGDDFWKTHPMALKRAWSSDRIQVEMEHWLRSAPRIFKPLWKASTERLSPLQFMHCVIRNPDMDDVLGSYAMRMRWKCYTIPPLLPEGVFNLGDGHPEVCARCWEISKPDLKLWHALRGNRYCGPCWDQLREISNGEPFAAVGRRVPDELEIGMLYEWGTFKYVNRDRPEEE